MLQNKGIFLIVLFSHVMGMTSTENMCEELSYTCKTGIPIHHLKYKI
jgi:hypothetical protein